MSLICIIHTFSLEYRHFNKAELSPFNFQMVPLCCRSEPASLSHPVKALGTRPISTVIVVRVLLQSYELPGTVLYMSEKGTVVSIYQHVGTLNVHLGLSSTCQRNPCFEYVCAKLDQQPHQQPSYYACTNKLTCASSCPRIGIAWCINTSRYKYSWIRTLDPKIMKT